MLSGDCTDSSYQEVADRTAVLTVFLSVEDIKTKRSS